MREHTHTHKTLPRFSLQDEHVLAIIKNSGTREDSEKSKLLMIIQSGNYVPVVNYTLAINTVQYTMIANIYDTYSKHTDLEIVQYHVPVFT